MDQVFKLKCNQAGHDKEIVFVCLNKQCTIPPTVCEDCLNSHQAHIKLCVRFEEFKEKFKEGQLIRKKQQEAINSQIKTTVDIVIQMFNTFKNKVKEEYDKYTSINFDGLYNLTNVAVMANLVKGDAILDDLQNKFVNCMNSMLNTLVLLEHDVPKQKNATHTFELIKGTGKDIVVEGCSVEALKGRGQCYVNPSSVGDLQLHICIEQVNPEFRKMDTLGIGLRDPVTNHYICYYNDGEIKHEKPKGPMGHIKEYEYRRWAQNNTLMITINRTNQIMSIQNMSINGEKPIEIPIKFYKDWRLYVDMAGNQLRIMQ